MIGAEEVEENPAAGLLSLEDLEGEGGVETPDEEEEDLDGVVGPLENRLFIPFSKLSRVVVVAGKSWSPSGGGVEEKVGCCEEEEEEEEEEEGIGGGGGGGFCTSIWGYVPKNCRAGIAKVEEM